MEKGNGEAFHQLGGYYDQGLHGMPQDQQKANELYLKAGELGCARGYYNMGVHYSIGRGVEVDEKKAKHYYELAAIMGLSVRYNLGIMEEKAGNDHRAMKHWIIAAKAGNEKSLDAVKHGFRVGDVTKDEYETTLRAYHERQKEMKSDARERAEASRMFR